MESVKNHLSNLLTQSLLTHYPDVINSIQLTIPDEQFGDFSTNIALVTGKRLARNPRELANEMKDVLLSDSNVSTVIREIDVAGPGFLNLTIHQSVYRDLLMDIERENGTYGTSVKYQGKTAVVDYSAPNVAKRFSIGHLRSTIIGQAIYNLLASQGYTVIGVNHLGDWGTQFGKLIIALQKWNEKPIESVSFNDLEKLYVRFHQEAENDESLVVSARHAFKRLEDGELAERQLWQQLIDISLKEFDKIYRLLGVKIDFAIGESFYLDQLQSVIDDAYAKGLVEDSQGAKIIRFSNENTPPGLFIKSDGASTYFLRDLATIKYRKERWNPDLYVYEVGSEQKLHLQQVFEAAHLLGYSDQSSLHHIAHGLISTKEGKMSTRKGNTIKLYDVLKKVIEKADSLSSDHRTAIKVGVGALKYNDLKRTPSSPYVFDWDEILNLDGNTGPYVQYTYARTNSVLQNLPDFEYNPQMLFELNTDELRLVRRLSEYQDVVVDATEKLAPSLVCHYIYSVCQAFNTFYNNNRIINAPNYMDQRVALTRATNIVLKNSMNLLGIPVLKRM
ncbi:arginine--tRNA ligase [candidate division WWE3 bacterium]|nr:arginine--tRNA ligase [candidate division WWE3 bacterium]